MQFPSRSQVQCSRAIYEHKGLMSADERKLFRAEWEARKQNPLALSNSPMVVDATGRKRG